MTIEIGKFGFSIRKTIIGSTGIRKEKNAHTTWWIAQIKRWVMFMCWTWGDFDYKSH